MGVNHISDNSYLLSDEFPPKRVLRIPSDFPEDIPVIQTSQKPVDLRPENPRILRSRNKNPARNEAAYVKVPIQRRVSSHHYFDRSRNPPPSSLVILNFVMDIGITNSYMQLPLRNSVRTFLQLLKEMRFRNLHAVIISPTFLTPQTRGSSFALDINPDWAENRKPDKRISAV